VPPAPVPPEIQEFLLPPRPAVIATLRRDGSPHTAGTWYDWEDGRVLLNMDVGRVRLRHLRRDPRTSLTVLDENAWHRHVTLAGVVEDLHDDADLSDIDRLARRYTGRPYSNRERGRVSGWLRVESWHSWDGSRPMPAQIAAG
jgi:PPOX class probable F420-dependent enzyme